MHIVSNFKDSLESIRRKRNLSIRQAAKMAGTSHATLLAYEKGSKSPGIDTLSRLIEALGFDIEIRLHRRVREMNGMPRGEELAQVLQLAEQFPSNPKRNLEFPKLGELCAQSD